MPTESDFDAVYFGKSNPTERGQGASGEPQASRDNSPSGLVYGYDPENSQFSSDKTSDPQAMAEQANGSAFADLQRFLNNSSYTAGSRVCNESKELWKSPHDAAPGAGDGKTGPAEG